MREHLCSHMATVCQREKFTKVLLIVSCKQWLYDTIRILEEE